MLFPLVHEMSVAHVHITGRIYQCSHGNCHHRLGRVLANSAATISSLLCTEIKRKLSGNRNSLGQVLSPALVDI